MKVNSEAIKQLIDEKFKGNKSAFAQEIGIERSQVSRIVNEQIGDGALFFGGLYEYCEKNKLNFRDYIFLPNDVNKINDQN